MFIPPVYLLDVEPWLNHIYWLVVEEFVLLPFDAYDVVLCSFGVVSLLVNFVQVFFLS